MPLPAVHFVLAGQVLERWQRTPAHAPFDPLACAARHAFLQGTLGPDMGFYPGGEPLLSELAHNHRPGDLTRTLMDGARTDAEVAFAWGWLTHVLADVAIHPSINDHAARLAARTGRRDPQSLMAAHSRLELGLDVHLLMRRPGLARIPIAPCFDARSIEFLVGAYHATYGLSFDAGWLLRSHRAAARMARALRLLERLHAHAAPHRPHRLRRSLLCTLASLLAPRLTPGRRAFLEPVRPPRRLLASVADVAAGFDARVHRLQLDRLAGLGNPDLDGLPAPLPLSA